MTTGERTRGGCLSAWLAVAIVATAIRSLSAAMIMSSPPTKEALVAPDQAALILLVSLVDGVFLIAIWNWKRWGVFGLAATAAIGLVFSLSEGVPLWMSATQCVALSVAVILIGSVWANFDPQSPRADARSDDEPRECPLCRRTCAASSTTCECGYSFRGPTSPAKAPAPRPRAKRAEAAPVAALPSNDLDDAAEDEDPPSSVVPDGAASCPECKAECGGDDDFCDACGYRLRPRACPACQAVNRSAAKFCRGCGVALAPLRGVIRPDPVAPVNAAAVDVSRKPPRRVRPVRVFEVGDSSRVEVRCPDCGDVRTERANVVLLTCACGARLSVQHDHDAAGDA